MRLFIDMRIELPHECTGFREVGLLEHPIVDIASADGDLVVPHRANAS